MSFSEDLSITDHSNTRENNSVVEDDHHHHLDHINSSIVHTIQHHHQYHQLPNEQLPDHSQMHQNNQQHNQFHHQLIHNNNNNNQQLAQRHDLSHHLSQQHQQHHPQLNHQDHQLHHNLSLQQLHNNQLHHADNMSNNLSVVIATGDEKDDDVHNPFITVIGDEDHENTLALEKELTHALSVDSVSITDNNGTAVVHIEQEMNATRIVPISLYEEDCDSIRRKISTLLAAKSMTQIEFLKELGCSSDSLSRFMKLRGPWSGAHNSVFWAAQRYFSSNLSDDGSRKRRASPLDADEAEALLKKTRLQMKFEKKSLKTFNDDLFQQAEKIILPFEGERKVPIYDSCDEIRFKSVDFMEQCGLRTKEWLRMIGNVNTKSWNDFLSYKGERAGAANRAYYNAYVMLEKIRIAKGDEKTESRLAAEEEFGPIGRPLKHDNSSADRSVSKQQEILRFVAEIKLDREEGGKVPVYDNCDIIREKSLDFISNFGLRISDWLRLIGNVNSKSWRDFMSYKGERAGASNKSYYCAYVFLEKIRLARAEGKTPARMQAEQDYGEQGRPLKHDT